MTDAPAPRRLMLITGASAGIGAAFAHAYARAGWDLALTARRADRLADLARALEAEHDARAHVIEADLGAPDGVDRILAGLPRPADGLVNNAGFGPKLGFTPGSWPEHAHAIEVMATAPTRLAIELLPGMRARGFGRIVNVASMMGLFPATAGPTLYSPVKHYLVRLSETLHWEAKADGVHVTALCPGLTRSEFHAVAGMQRGTSKMPGFLWQRADTVAEFGRRACEENRPIAVSGVINHVMLGLIRLLPPGTGRALISRSLRATTSRR